MLRTLDGFGIGAETMGTLLLSLLSLKLLSHQLLGLRIWWLSSPDFLRAMVLFHLLLEVFFVYVKLFDHHLSAGNFFAIAANILNVCRVVLY